MRKRIVIDLYDHCPLSDAEEFAAEIQRVHQPSLPVRIEGFGPTERYAEGRPPSPPILIEDAGTGEELHDLIEPFEDAPAPSFDAGAQGV